MGLCTGLLYYKIRTNGDIKKGKVSAVRLTEGPSGKTIKKTYKLYNIARVLGISCSCGRQEVAGITDDVHP